MLFNRIMCKTENKKIKYFELLNHCVYVYSEFQRILSITEVAVSCG